MIPIYRAKDKHSDKYVEGLLSKAIIGGNEAYFIENWEKTRIDPATLSIHFPSWIANDEDDNDIKAFASFNKIGGDIVEVRDNFVGVSGVLHLNEHHELCIDDCRITLYDLSQMQIVGIKNE